VDSDTGFLAQPACQHTALQAFLKGTEPTEFCMIDHSKPFGLRPSFMNPGEVAPPIGNELPLLGPTTAEQMAPLPPVDEPGDPEAAGGPDAIILQ